MHGARHLAAVKDSNSAVRHTVHHHRETAINKDMWRTLHQNRMLYISRCGLLDDDDSADHNCPAQPITGSQCATCAAPMSSTFRAPIKSAALRMCSSCSDVNITSNIRVPHSLVAMRYSSGIAQQLQHCCICSSPAITVDSRHACSNKLRSCSPDVHVAQCCGKPV
eukprot:13530-Heterococcus_DN1.PRE.7